jgi:Holliday junction resolvase RusA-like endonuclease
MFTFEFTVPGPPVSHQTHDRARLAIWKETVRRSAAVSWPFESPADTPLKIAVTYYHEGAAVRIDNDNLLKPIQDALNGLVYEDDRQITDTFVRKTSIDGRFQVRRAPMTLLEAFAQGDEFIHVLVTDAPDHAELPR